MRRAQWRIAATRLLVVAAHHCGGWRWTSGNGEVVAEVGTTYVVFIVPSGLFDYVLCNISTSVEIRSVIVHT